MESISLPYYAASATLPAALPTFDEIDNSQDIICDQSARKVVGVGDYFIVKYGLAVDLTEGENMMFVEQLATVPVPRVYALFRHPDNKKAYIIMERVAGKHLETEWPLLSRSDKEAISIKLRSNLDELRQLQSPGGYCSLGQRPLLDGVFWTDGTVDTIAGPFKTESELNEAMIQKYIFNNLPLEKAHFYRRAFPFIFRCHPPVFTHGDLQRKNIMVQKVPISNDGDEVSFDYKVTFLDWEVAGWYPSYWEYSRALFACGRWNDDWSFWVEKILEPFLNEWVWMDMLLKELWS
ncbi:putative phosphotransferase enzyme family protein [Phaeomoniella chlamydospora]|uniref:Putative phosphotransferase enzyme family protein n=1 Tax=Phaeomoniella chlamydospora TaxID=158046 RepID=A0A0G2F3I8_PHACM|nr:putative phosphotransferase enzyme family protein [Phaeomoniella chlamydospora]